MAPSGLHSEVGSQLEKEEEKSPDVNLTSTLTRNVTFEYKFKKFHLFKLCPQQERCT